MLVDINPNLSLPDYQLMLCKLNTEKISSLKNITDFEIKAYFANIDEISFNIPLYNDRENVTNRNEIYDLVNGDMLIFLNKMKYFYIDQADEKFDENGEAYKSVHAFSREFEMSQKKVIGYSAASRNLWDINNPIDDNGLEIGIMNYIEKRTSWTTGYISSNLKTKYRAFDFSNSNILQMMIEIQSSFSCLFKFNTIDKIIDIYEVTQLGKNQGLYISDNNYINSLNKKINYGEIKTRLMLYGENNTSIQSVNITGQPYLENYDYYKKPEFMSQSLIDALDVYEAFIVTKQGDFSGYLDDLQTNNGLLGVKSDELVALNTELKAIRLNLDIAITDNQPTTVYKTQETDKLAEVTIKNGEVEVLEDAISAINSNITTLKNGIAASNHFSLVQLKELDSFIKEEVYNDTNYTEDNIQELYDEGVKLLNKVSQPAIQFDTDVVDFLSVVECQHMWNKFILGDLVKVNHAELGINYEVRLVGYIHKPNSNSLSLTFSNRDSVDNADIYLRDLLNSMNVTSTTVDFNKLKWDKGEDAQSMISQYIDNALNLSKQEILKATGQKPMIDERGIWIVKENLDGSIDPKQMRLINNILAITNDNWNTVSTAVSGMGINAEVIRGKLGQFAEVQAHQIVVGDFGEKISNDVLDIDLDLDGVVEQDTLYNQVMISGEKGIQVLDKGNRERIRLGNYKIGKYGLLIKDKSGSTTVLDEDGILQTWQEGNTDNVDVDKPLELYIYIPVQTNIIHKAILRFKMEKFRAYSTSTISGGGFTESTADGGSFVQSTLDGGGTTEDTGSSGINVEWVVDETSSAGDPSHRHDFDRVHAHQHAVTFPAHAHYMNIPDHQHGVEIPEHNHDIEYGIYESTYPSNVKIKINGLDYTSYLGARDGSFNENKDNIDVTGLLEVGKWNLVSLSSETLGRLGATMFIQAFVNTTRKSIILDDRHLDTSTIGLGGSFGESSIAASRPIIDSGVDYLYRISINDGIAYVHSSAWTGSNINWESEFNVGNATTSAITVDGSWERDNIEGKYKLKTKSKPHLFWVNEGTLYVQNWNDLNSKTILASDVVEVSAIRGWRNISFPTQDQGMICLYIKSNGKVYYRNYCMGESGVQSWDIEREIEEFTGIAENINMYITNDYRVGIVIQDTLNKTHILITDRNWTGMASPIDFISTGITDLEFSVYDIKYKETNGIENITTSISDITFSALYASPYNAFVNLENVADEFDDWGRIINIEVEQELFNTPTINLYDIAGSQELPVGNITMIDSRHLVVTINAASEIGMNNAEDVRVTISSVLNAAGYAFDTIEETFTPINLVPTFIPLPEVESIYNE